MSAVLVSFPPPAVLVSFPPPAVPSPLRPTAPDCSDPVAFLLDAARAWRRPDCPGQAFPDCVWRAAASRGLAWALPRLESLLCVMTVHSLIPVDFGPPGAGPRTSDALGLARVLDRLVVCGAKDDPAPHPGGRLSDPALVAAEMRLALRLDPQGREVLHRVIAAFAAARPPRVQQTAWAAASCPAGPRSPAPREAPAKVPAPLPAAPWAIAAE